jgi:subtilisin family serine protease
VLVLASAPAAPADRSPLLDQWALERAGFAPPSEAGSTDPRPIGTPVVVAVIDSGLDYSHADLPRERLWRNPGETPNGRDDDGDGRVDDLIGWNFVSNSNDPADTIGHGTHVAGLIAAAGGDSVEIMPLKILDAGGKGRATSLVDAVLYAIAHGAQIINLSIGGQGISATERLAIDYAVDSDVLVVVAAGNAAANTVNYGPAGVPGVLSVAATDREDRRLGFSNFGQAVQIAAPGVDILSLRAAGTDLNLALRVDGYAPGGAFVGSEQRYYRATGTSFAAPLVSAAAALIWSRSPGLTNLQIARMLLMSAADVETPGWDLYTGAGRLDAARALQADPDWYLLAQVRRPSRR